MYSIDMVRELFRDLKKKIKIERKGIGEKEKEEGERPKKNYDKERRKKEKIHKLGLTIQA